MRITQNFSIGHLLQSVNSSRERIDTLSRNLATGKRINRISDDPGDISRLLQFKKSMKWNTRYGENLKNALDFMTMTSQSLDDAAGIMGQLKELAVQGADSLSGDEWTAFAEQTDQLLQEMVDLANTRFKDRYIFGGSNTGREPFLLSADGSQVTVNAHGVDGRLKAEIGYHQIESYNITGSAAFLDGTDLFQTIIKLREGFQTHDKDVVQGILEDLESGHSQLLQQNTEIGAKINRFELMLEQNVNQGMKLQELTSAVEDTDIAEAISNMQMEETGLQSALQVLSKTLNISLADYL
ncbi:MAG: flagellar hook-associated protein FlgL [Calditrichia bacterium]